MDKTRMLWIMRTIGSFFFIVLFSGCNFWGLDDLKVTITSPAEDTTISAGEAVDFQSEATFGTSPYTYEWDFDGGATDSTDQNPGSTTFSTAGTYTVTLTVTDSSGSTAETSVIVTVESSSAFTVSITSPSDGTTISEGGLVNFQSTVSNGTSPYTYQWDFDGGATDSTLQDPGKTMFSTAGTYTVMLTVTDDSGSTAQDSVIVYVQ